MSVVVRVRLEQCVHERKIHQRPSGLMRHDLLSNDSESVLIVCVQDFAERVFNRVVEQVDASTRLWIMAIICDWVFGRDVLSSDVFPFVDL